MTAYADFEKQPPVYRITEENARVSEEAVGELSGMVAAVPPPSHLNQEGEAQGQRYPQAPQEAGVETNPQVSQAHEDGRLVAEEGKQYTTLEVVQPVPPTCAQTPWAAQFTTAPGPVMPAPYPPMPIIYQSNQRV